MLSTLSFKSSAEMDSSSSERKTDSTDNSTQSQSSLLKRPSVLNDSWENNLDANLLENIGISIVDNKFFYCNFCKCWLPQCSKGKTGIVCNIKVHIGGTKHRMVPHNFWNSAEFGDVPSLPKTYGLVKNTVLSLFNQPLNDEFQTKRKEHLDALIKKVCEENHFNNEYVIFNSGNRYSCSLCNSCFTFSSLHKQCKRALVSHFGGIKHKKNLQKITGKNSVASSSSSLFNLSLNKSPIKNKDTIIHEICQKYQFNYENITFKDGNEYICSVCNSCLILGSNSLELGSNNGCRDALISHFRGKKHRENVEKISKPKSVEENVEKISKPNSVEENVEKISKLKSVKENVEKISKPKSVEENVEKISIVKSVKENVEKISKPKSVEIVKKESENLDALIKDICVRYKFNQEYVTLKKGHEYICNLCKSSLLLKEKSYKKELISHFRGKKHKRKLEKINKSQSTEVQSDKTEKLEVVIRDVCQQFGYNHHEYIVLRRDNEYSCSLCDACLKLTSKGCVKALLSHLYGKKHERNFKNVTRITCIDKFDPLSESCQLPNPISSLIDEFHVENRDKIDGVIKEICLQYQINSEHISFRSGNTYMCRICDCLLSLSNDNCRKMLSEHLCGIEHRKKLQKNEFKDHQGSNSLINYTIGQRDIYLNNSSSLVNDAQMKLSNLPPTDRNYLKDMSSADVIKLINKTFLVCLPNRLHYNKKFILFDSNKLIYCTICNLTLASEVLNSLCLGRIFIDHFVSILHSDNLRKSLWYTFNLTVVDREIINSLLKNCKSSVLIKFLYELPTDIDYFNINDFVEFMCCNDDSYHIIKCNVCILLFEVDNDTKSFKNTCLYDHILSWSHKYKALKFPDQILHGKNISESPYTLICPEKILATLVVK